MTSVPPTANLKQINTEHIVAITSMPTELLQNGSLATHILGMENIDLTTLWLRLKHIEKTMSATPSVVFIVIDPYIGCDADETDFDQKVTRFGIPHTPQALQSMIDTAKKSNIDEQTKASNVNISISVSQLCFEAKKKTRTIYDQFYQVTKEGRDLAEEVEHFKTSNAGNGAEEAEQEHIAKEAGRLGGLLKDNKDRIAKFKKSWELESDKIVNNLDDDDLYVVIHGDIVSLKKLFSSNTTTTDIRTFRSAIFDPHQHAIVVVYHGDTNMRVHNVDDDTFCYEWIKARTNNIQKYEESLVAVTTSEPTIPNTQWPMPIRSTDCFPFNISFSSITLFIEGVLATRHKYLMALVDARLRIEREKKDDLQLENIDAIPSLLTDAPPPVKS